MSNRPPTWQNALKPQLVRRLTRPLVQPGVVNIQMGERYLKRSQTLLNRLPLLDRQMQRWSGIAELQSEQTPIVYAQPLSKEISVEGDSSALNVGSSNRQRQLPVAYAKVLNRDRSRNPSSFPNSSQQATTTSVVPHLHPKEHSESLGQHQPNLPQTAPTNNHRVLSSQQSDRFISNSSTRIGQSSETSPVQVQRKLDTTGTSTTQLSSPSRDPLVSTSDSAFHLTQTEASLPSSLPSAEKAVVSPQVLPTEPSATGEVPLVVVSPQVPQNTLTQSPTQEALPLGENAIVSPQVFPTEPSATSEVPLSKNLSSSQNNQRPVVQAKLFSPHSQAQNPKLQSQKLPVVQTPPQVSSYQSDSLNFYTVPVTKQDPGSISKREKLTSTQTSGLRVNPNEILSIHQQQGTILEQPTNRSTVLTNSLSSSGNLIRQLAVSEVNSSSQINVDALVDKVERKLMRRLVIESERRGKRRWP